MKVGEIRGREKLVAQDIRKSEYAFAALKTVGLVLLAAYVFYDSPAAAAVLAPAGIFT